MADREPLAGGDLLRRYRLDAGLTQEELAERAGLSARAIRALEAGARRAPRKDTVQLLATALGLSESERGRFALSLRGAAALRVAPAPPPAHAAAARRRRTPLVGRARERALLARALGAEAPPLTLLAGEPGIGKSRLLEETAAYAQAHGWTTLVGGCHRRSAQQPFSPVVEALTHFLATRDEAQRRRDAQGCAWLVGLLPELAQQTLVPSPGWTLPPAQERRLLFAAVARFLTNIAGPAGVLLLLDDLHWAGEEALDLLATLLREPGAPGAAPVRVLGAYRDTEVTSADPLPLLLADLAREELAASVALEPLTDEDAAALLAALLADVADAADAATRARLLARAGGVPFFLISGAQEARVRAQAPQPDALVSLPWSAAESIRQRAALLSPPAAELLAIGAVAERALPRPALLRCAEQLGLDEQAALRALQEVIHARLMIETTEGGYRVTHDLIWETLQAAMTGARRAALHRQIATALAELPQSGRRSEELAWHYSQGDDLPRALPYALEAGDHAEAIYAHREAEAHYSAARAWAQTLGDRTSEGAALEKLAAVYYRLARYDRAFDALTQAMALYRATGNWERLVWATTDRIQFGEPLRQSASDLSQLSELMATLRIAVERRDGVPASDTPPAELTVDLMLASIDGIASIISPNAVARLLLCLTTRLLFSGRSAEALAPSEKTIHYARLAGNLRVESLAQAFRAEAQLAQGQVDAASASAEPARQVAMASGDLEAVYVALEAMANIHGTQAEPISALATLREMLEVSQRLGDASYTGNTLTALAACSFILGRWDDARAYLSEATGSKRHNEFHHGRTPASILALLDLARGDATTREAIARAIDADDSGRIWVWTAATLAEREILAGEASAAAARLRPLIARMSEADREPSSACYLLAPLAWAESQMGQRERAAATLAQARGTAARLRNRMALVDIERAAAHLALAGGRWDDARRALDASLALCAAAPYPYAEAKARLLAGELLAAMRSPQQAREQYAAALAICARLGERLYRDQIEQALERLLDA